MRKRIPIILACVMLIVTGCAQRAYRGSKNIDTQYREWVDGIEIFEKKSGKMAYLNEKDNTIELGILCDDTKSYEDLCSIVNAHNDFVDNNPGYFEPDTQICILGTMKDWDTPIYFYNGECEYFNLDRLEGKLDVTETAKMQFARVNLKSIPKGISEMSGKFDVPIVILRYDNAAPSEDAYKILEKFEDPQQVMIEFVGAEYDPEQVAESIRKYAPDVRVFDGEKKRYID